MPRNFQMKKIFSICADCRSEGIKELDMLVTNETHETCHACARDVEIQNVPPRKDVEIEVIHKGFAGILHFWSVREEVYPETIYTPEQARKINRQEAGGTSCVRRILSW